VAPDGEAILAGPNHRSHPLGTGIQAAMSQNTTDEAGSLVLADIEVDDAVRGMP